MKLLKIIFASLCLWNATAQASGICQASAQTAAEAIAKINGYGSHKYVLDLQGSPGQIETYQDIEGYFKIVTNTGMSDDTCTVESVTFNPQP